MFTKDDQLEGGAEKAAPRDNVVFEAGYFMRARGKERVLIVNESGTKMPADLGGTIFVTLPDSGSIESIGAEIDRYLGTL